MRHLRRHCRPQFEPSLAREAVASDQVIQVECGNTLNFGRLISGARAYLAFAGRMEVPARFGSFSTHLLAGCDGSTVGKGDIIQPADTQTVDFRRLKGEYRLRCTQHPQLRLVAGAEESYFAPDTIDHFYSQTYRVSAQSSRMRICLTGSTLYCENQSQVISSDPCPGTVQIPPDGKPIVSFVGGQTISGYPRIAHVISADWHLLGQSRPATGRALPGSPRPRRTGSSRVSRRC